MRNLWTGDEHTFCGEARENIMCVALTGSTLAFASFDGVLYVADLRSPDAPVRLRLPSSAVTGLTTDGHAVALLAGVGMILVYSSDTKRLMEHRFETQSVGGQPSNVLIPHKMILDSRRGTVDILSCQSSSAGDADSDYIPTLYVGHMRLQLGQSVSQTSLLKPTVSSMLQFRTGTESHYQIDHLQYTGIPGRYQVVFRYIETGMGGRQRPRQENLQGVSIMLDAGVPLLCQDDHSLVSGSGHSSMPCLSGSHLRWKDAMYFFEHTDMPITTYVKSGQVDPDDITCKLRIAKPGSNKLVHQSWMECGQPGEWMSIPLFAAFVNDSCLVTVAVDPNRTATTDEDAKGRILVWWFDEERDIPGARSTGLWGLENPLSQMEGEDRMRKRHYYVLPEGAVRPFSQLHTAYRHKLPYEEGRRSGYSEHVP